MEKKKYAKPSFKEVEMEDLMDNNGGTGTVSGGTTGCTSYCTTQCPGDCGENV